MDSFPEAGASIVQVSTKPRQLHFGYAAWRDTKLALVVFVGQKGLTEVVARGRVALTAHPRFRRAAETGEETELRASMAWPGDDDRVVDLHVLFMHTEAA